MADKVKVKTLERIDDPRREGSHIGKGVTVQLPRQIAERLVLEGKVEKVDEKGNE